ncbi:MAG: MBOAT family O-acyltransferase [Pseudomonadota bacterium]
MLFQEPKFFIFLPLVLGLYLLLRSPGRQNPLLLLASYVFYMYWDQRFLILILVSTAVDYLIARELSEETPGPRVKARLAGLLLASFPLLVLVPLPLPGRPPLDPDMGIGAGALGLIYTAGLALFFLALEACRRLGPHRKRKALLVLSLAVNLGLLGFFKYFNFFIESFVDLLGLFHLQASRPTLDLILPVGISFYTFQTMAYTIDVYRGQTKACAEFIDFALYVAYFPQLVAGPIERSESLLPQLRQPRKINFDQIARGCRLMLWGLFLKLFVADSLGLVVETCYAMTDGGGRFTGSGAAALVGGISFSFQIFGDFAGYSSMAIGISQFFGISLRQNFRLPFFATDFQDFWRRWHISLSTWLRDYLYIPLGGNRGGPARTKINLMITMVLGGLWHGAAWTFLAWGLLHGLLLAATRNADGWRRAVEASIVIRLASIIFTFGAVTFCFMIFRAPNLAFALDMWVSIFTAFDPGPGTREVTRLAKFALFHLVPLLLVQWINRNQRDEADFDRWPAWARGLLYYLLLVMVAAAANQYQQFIYFQF